MSEFPHRQIVYVESSTPTRPPGKLASLVLSLPVILWGLDYLDRKVSMLYHSAMHWLSEFAHSVMSYWPF